MYNFITFIHGFSGFEMPSFSIHGIPFTLSLLHLFTALHVGLSQTF